MSHEDANDNKKMIQQLHLCTKCGKDFIGNQCPYCGSEPSESSSQFPYTSHIEQPTALWYLLPFLLGLIGGIIAYVAVRHEDTEMAESLLLLSIMWTAILGVLYVLFIW